MSLPCQVLQVQVLGPWVRAATANKVVEFAARVVCLRLKALRGPGMASVLLCGRWALLLALAAAICPTTLALPGSATAARRTEGGGISSNASAEGKDSTSSELVDGEDWWAGAVDEDALPTLALHGAEGGLWAGAFVPPPPRPHFLDERAAPDGLTTCDLCAWAWPRPQPPPRGRGFLDADGDAGKVGWGLTLAIVSVLSAGVGAVVMVTALQCRNRLKTVGSSGLCSVCTRSPRATSRAANPQRRERADDKIVTAAFDKQGGGGGGGGVWTWLASRRAPAGPAQLSSPPPTAPAENHYTLDEALYAELDRESSSSPAYQNTAYSGEDADADAAPSSAPSSAYYSDLSCATAPDRTYETVGVAVAVALTPNPSTSWENTDIALRRPPLPRLAAITETITVPSDYV